MDALELAVRGEIPKADSGNGEVSNQSKEKETFLSPNNVPPATSTPTPVPTTAPSSSFPAVTASPLYAEIGLSAPIPPPPAASDEQIYSYAKPDLPAPKAPQPFTGGPVYAEIGSGADSKAPPPMTAMASSFDEDVQTNPLYGCTGLDETEPIGVSATPPPPDEAGEGNADDVCHNPLYDSYDGVRQDESEEQVSTFGHSVAS